MKLWIQYIVCGAVAVALAVVGLLTDDSTVRGSVLAGLALLVGWLVPSPRERSSRRPPTSPPVAGLAAAALAGLLSSCAPALVGPLVAVCPGGCEAGLAACLTAARAVEAPRLRGLALLGCTAGAQLCALGCEAAADAVDAWGARAEALCAEGEVCAGGLPGPCGEAYEGCAAATGWQPGAVEACDRWAACGP
jgi:hypothetical protein